MWRALTLLFGSIFLHKLAMLLPIVPAGALMVKSAVACIAHHGNYGYDVVCSASVWARRELFCKGICLGELFSLNHGQRRGFPIFLAKTRKIAHVLSAPTHYWPPAEMLAADILMNSSKCRCSARSSAMVNL